MLLNRLHNATNPFQGTKKKILCVCSAGLLRSPSLATILGWPEYGFNTRAAGIEESYALIPVDKVLLKWADVILCVENSVKLSLVGKFGDYIMRDCSATILTLDIPDNFGYMDPKLVEEINFQLPQILRKIA